MTAAFMAPALVATTPSKSSLGSSSSRSRTPQVKAPWAPPPCKARLRVLVAELEVALRFGTAWVVVIVDLSMFSLPSMRSPAAIYGYGGAGNRASAVTAQEDGERADLLDRRKALVRLVL